MASQKEKGSLVELVVRNGELCIETSNAPAKDPKFLTGIEFVKFFSDSRDEAIQWQAPAAANAYMGSKSINPTGGLVIGAINCIAPVVYFHIDDDQAQKAPMPKPKEKISYRSEYYCDGEAD